MSKDKPMFNKIDTNSVLFLIFMFVAISMSIAVFSTSYIDDYGNYHESGGPVYLWQVALLVLGCIGLVVSFFKLLSASRELDDTNN